MPFTLCRGSGLTGPGRTAPREEPDPSVRAQGGRQAGLAKAAVVCFVFGVDSAATHTSPACRALLSPRVGNASTWSCGNYRTSLARRCTGQNRGRLLCTKRALNKGQCPPQLLPVHPPRPPGALDEAQLPVGDVPGSPALTVPPPSPFSCCRQKVGRGKQEI
ncbi:hypothetical protein CB1_000296005 [Camelus ferus]|nr:hypothetical protein CB1_000296005 [Camelus ferus]